MADRLKAKVSSVGEQLREAADAIKVLNFAYNLDVAYGVQLDSCGKLAGEPRNGENDDLYRARIKIRIRLNNGNGEGDVLIEAAELASGGDVELYERFPAAVEIIGGPTATINRDVLSMVKPYKAASVGLGLGEGSGARFFVFATEGAAIGRTGGGHCETSATDGTNPGCFSELYTRG